MAILKIEWINPDSKGWVDHILLSMFEREKVVRFEHPMINGSDMEQCQVIASVFDKIAIIDYAKHRDINESRGIHIGQTILSFENNLRKKINQVLWRYEDTGDVVDFHPIVSYSE